MITDAIITKEFRLFADEPVSPEADNFGEDMFVEWEGNEKTRLEAQGFYAGFRAAESYHARMLQSVGNDK